LQPRELNCGVSACDYTAPSPNVIIYLFRNPNQYTHEMKQEIKQVYINQSRCRTWVTSVGDSINESLICRPVLQVRYWVV